METAPVFKVEFFDNSAYQYDANASEVSYAGPGGGKLFLGDRFSASFVQLQYRDCQTVVSCCEDMHGFAKEENVTYLRIDPDYDEDRHFEESCQFIQNSLIRDEQNVVVFCDNGNVKSAMILCYFLMVNNSLTLCEAYNHLRTCRPSVKIFPRLMKVLIEAEVQLRGKASLIVDGRIVRPYDSNINATIEGPLKY